jgi:hypothetical protein
MVFIKKGLKEEGNKLGKERKGKERKERKEAGKEAVKERIKEDDRNLLERF